MSRFSRFFKKNSMQDLTSSVAEYSVKVSARAKYIRLQISEADGLVVIIPKGLSQRHIDDILYARRDWIEKTSRKLKRSAPTVGAILPESLQITATGKQWQIEYQQTSSGLVSLRHKDDDMLILRGNITDQRACRLALQRWTVKHARQVLVPWLQKLSDQYELPFQKTMVRTQRTRWASYSSRGTISINSQLLFLQKEQVDYVFLHELCHSVQMNHSAAFWTLLEGMMPNYKKHHREIHNQAKNIPQWLLQK